MPRHKSGTRPTDPKLAKLAYTQEQLNKLEEIRDPRFKLRVARAEYANKVLLPDGTISDDTSYLKTAVHNAAIAARDKATDVQSMMAAATKFREEETIDAEIALNRYLFVVNDEGEPSVYFQCAVPGHPEEASFNGN